MTRVIQKLKQRKPPTWRLALWAIVAMAGVAYFGHPDPDKRVLSIASILLMGVIIFAFGLYLVQMQTTKNHWLLKHAHLIAAIAFALSLLIKIIDLLFHK
jgi:hypothetical protein